MNARISREFFLKAALYFEDRFIVVNYVFELYMNVLTEDTREQSIALERIKYLVEDSLDSCVFVGSGDRKIADAYTQSGLKVCTLPDSPYDQVIAGVLLSKFNAVMEGRMVIDEIKIKSDISDDVVFYVTIDDEFDFDAVNNAWWNSSNTMITDISKKSKREKVVSLKKDFLDWSELGYTWKAKEKKETQVVFISDTHPE